MKSLTFKAKMEELGTISSYSYPRVSDDNPYVELLFRTVKYVPSWPAKGRRIVAVGLNALCVGTIPNIKYSKLNYVTSLQRHNGKDREILAHRADVLLAARCKNLERWSHDIRNCEPVGEVHLNPEIKVA